MNKNVKKLIFLCICAVGLLAAAGTTLAWLSQQTALSTVVLVQTPATITISGSKRSELTRIPMELTSDDVINSNGTVTLRRVFCIESNSDYLIEIAHTTNITGLSFDILPVKKNNSEKTSGSSGWVSSGDSSEIYYYYPDAAPVEGAYLNKSRNIAIQEGAAQSLHDEIYSPSDSNKVQQNAEPLYWQSNSYQSYSEAEYSTAGANNDGTAIMYRYYVLEITFDNATNETDLFYLIASH